MVSFLVQSSPVLVCLCSQTVRQDTQHINTYTDSPLSASVQNIKVKLNILGQIENQAVYSYLGFTCVPWMTGNRESVGRD